MKGMVLLIRFVLPQSSEYAYCKKVLVHVRTKRKYCTDSRFPGVAIIQFDRGNVYIPTIISTKKVTVRLAVKLSPAK